MITVLLPTYNSGATVATALQSILDQTWREFELLIVDDGSTDDTEQIVRGFGDPRIRFVKKVHEGLAQTLNYGLTAATFDIIARMDADDICSRNRLEIQWNAFKALPEQSLLSTWYAVFSNTRLLYTVEPPTESDVIKKGLLLHSFLSHPGLMYRKATLLGNGGYRCSNERKAFEDYETWLYIKDRVEMSILPRVLIYQRFRKTSLSNDTTYKNSIIYEIQRPFYRDLRKHFTIADSLEEHIYRGWREYFFGDAAAARRFWSAAGSGLLRQPKILLAFLLTFLPSGALMRYNETRVRFTLRYWFTYYSKKNRNIRTELRPYLRRL